MVGIQSNWWQEWESCVLNVDKNSYTVMRVLWLTMQVLEASTNNEKINCTVDQDYALVVMTKDDGWW